MFTSGYYNSNLLFMLAIIALLAAIGSGLFLIIYLDSTIKDGEIMLLLTITGILAIAAMTLMCTSGKAKQQGIKDAITLAYPDAVISSNSKSFVSKGNSYTYKLDDKDIIVTDYENNVSIIREGQIVSTVKSAETTTKDAAVSDTKPGTSDNVKLQILQAYSENITNIVYTEENSSGYFKMNGEYFRFNVEGNSIVIRNDADKIINIISVNK